MEEKKLTDEEIIKALKVVGKETIAFAYDKEQKQFKYVTAKEIIDLIHRLQGENKQLEKDVHDMSWIIKVHKYCVGADHCQNSSTREFELQKQVDDLKEERYYTEQDTAKEILQELYDQIDENTPKWVGAQIKIIAKRKGVEVE